MIYFKTKPDELMKTLKFFENPRKYLLRVSSYKIMNDMNIPSVSEVSFNCQCHKAI